MTADRPARRPLLPAGLAELQLYHRPARLDADIARVAELGWEVVALDAAGWTDSAALHDDLASSLDLPAWYGRNLDALDELADDIGAGRYGFSPTAPGGLLVIRHFDRLHDAEPRVAGALLEILHRAAIEALRHGWPLACLIQSDDPHLAVGPVGASVVGWNPAERRPTDRLD